jgi:CheY-like chemotaxis protein
MLAEDNVVNQKLAVRLLEIRGHSVVVVGNGREALSALESLAFDAVLMDVQMPEMDGFEATEAIRAKETATGTHLPIVAMTAHAMKGDRERCLEAGMDGYVAKPLNANELFRVVESIADSAALVGRGAESHRTNSAGDAVFDPSVALVRVGGDPQLLKELVGLFLQECPRWMDEIRSAIAAREATKLRRAAHTLKGAVGSFGAPAAFEAALKLETMGQQGNLGDAERTFGELSEQVERLQPALLTLAENP